MGRLLAFGLILFLASRLEAHSTARYRLRVECTWSSTTHPGAFPPDAHFSWLGGGTHDATVSFWDAGVLASPGIVQMAETGATWLLEAEVEEAITAGSAASVLAWHHWFCPEETDAPACGPLVVELDVFVSHPNVTLVSMLGPTPDWFIGISGLALRDADGWCDTVVVDLVPYDGGSRAANVFALGGPLTIPQEPVSLITEESGQLIGPGSLGTFTFELLGECPDTDGNGVIDVDDLVNVILDWNTDGSANDGDVDGSGVVDIDDIVALILGWGPCR